MSASHAWIEWHLTPRGWETDTSPDRVLTCQYLEQRADFAGGVRRALQTVWHCNDPERIRTLMQRYGQFPPAESETSRG
jgi:hypothetical protein